MLLFKTKIIVKKKLLLVIFYKNGRVRKKKHYLFILLNDKENIGIVEIVQTCQLSLSLSLSLSSSNNLSIFPFSPYCVPLLLVNFSMILIKLSLLIFFASFMVSVIYFFIFFSKVIAILTIAMVVALSCSYRQ